MNKRNRNYMWATIALAILCAPLIAMTIDKIQKNKKAAQKWQKIDQQMYKYRIPAGWLVKYQGSGADSVVFVPDAKHTWK